MEKMLCFSQQRKKKNLTVFFGVTFGNQNLICRFGFKKVKNIVKKVFYEVIVS